MAIPPVSTRQICAHAGCESTDKLKACKGCMLVFYCGAPHQLAAWPMHKSFCRAVTAARQAEAAKTLAVASAGGVAPTPVPVAAELKVNRVPLPPLSPLYHEYDLSTLQHVGEGSFGVVFRVKWKGENVIVKVLKWGDESQIFLKEKEHLDWTRNQKITNAIERVGIIRNFHHPLLRTKYGLVFQDGGFPLEAALTVPDFKILHIIHVTKCLLETLRDLAQHGKAHRDFSTRNVLINDCGKVKVIDWASLIAVPALHTYPATVIMYRAPEEIFIKGKTFDASIDMWALGCILYKMATYETLFYCGPEENIPVMVSEMARLIGPPPTSYLRESRRCFLTDSSTHGVALTRMALALFNRGATIPEIGALVGLFKRCVRWEPSQRITAAAALKHPLFTQQPAAGKK